MFDDYRKSFYQTFGDNASADGAKNPIVEKLVNEIVNEKTTASPILMLTMSVVKKIKAHQT